MPRKLNTYTDFDVEKAREEVEAGASVKSTALKYRIPRMTLSRRIKGTGKDRCGPDPILTKEEEELLEQWLIFCSKRGFPKRKIDLFLSVKELVLLNNRDTNFKNGLPGEGWYRGFLRRHPSISCRTPESVSVASSCVSEKDIRGWFSSVENLLKEENWFDILSHPSRVFNGDESGFLLNPGSTGSALALKGSKNVYEIDSGPAKCSITVMFTFSASGLVVPPMIVYPYKRIPTEITNSVPLDWGIGRSDSGWMRAEVFFEYIGNIFIPFLDKNSIQRPVILFLDGHKSHLTLQLSEMCSEQGIVLVSLYPNATRILQPADVCTFRPLKEVWRQSVVSWKNSNPGREITKKNFAPILDMALAKLSPEAIMNGFKACGIFPWDANSIDYEKCIGGTQQNMTEDTNFSSNNVLSKQKLLSKVGFEEIVGSDILDKIKHTDGLTDVEKVLKNLWKYFESTESGDDDSAANTVSSGRNEQPSQIMNITEKNTSSFPLQKNPDETNASTQPGSSSEGQSGVSHETNIKSARRQLFSIGEPSSASGESPLAKILHWPESPKRKGKRNVPRYPFVTSSRQWRLFHLAKENKKQEELNLKEEKKLQQRKRKAEKEERKTSKKACGQVESGVQGMFGPWEAGLGAHVQSLCEALDLPHMEARLDLDPGFRELSINLHPPQNYLNDAVKDLISFLNWTRVAIVYEEDYGLFKLQELVKGPPGARTEIYIRQANPSSYRHVLREIRQKDIFKVIVDTNPAHMNHFFKAILQLQMNDYRYHYMFTTFDIETFDLEDFKYNSVNMTAFRLIDVENPKVMEILTQMERFQPIGHPILNRSGVIEAEPALVFDSVYVFATGLASLESSHTLRPANLSCDLEVPWQDGPSLYNYINAVTHHGLTGRIEFTEGRRSNFKMDLLKLKREELRKVGEWSPSSGLNITDSTAFYETTTPNITLIVMTREERPYVMVREGNVTGNARYEGFCIDLLKWVATEVGFQYAIRLVPDHKYGVYDPETKQWNGIVRELIEKRADLAVASMTINYARESVIDFTKPFMNLGIGILFKVPSSQPARLFSFMNPLAVEIWLYVLAAYLLVSFTLFVMARFSPYEWNNPHPCSPEAHIIENQFSISNSFWFITGTFLRQGSGLNPKTSERMPNRMFSFLNPLAAEIWLWMLVAYVFVSLTIWVVARFSPREWTLPVTCPCTPGEEEEEDGLLVTYDLQLHNDFTLGNAFWFTLGSLMQQGSDLNPKATSTRIVGGIWWFFTLIIISSYTANLAAFLTVERMITPIESAADLSEQTDIAYGTLDGGSTMTFFRDSKIGIYQKMWRYMESKKPSVFVPSYEEGIKRVLDGNYAFLMESTMLDYAVQRDCNLTQIGGLLDSKGYGIATPKGSPWRDKISLAILELQEKGNIQILYDKWWKNTGDVCNREDKNKESKANALGVENIGGVFVVLLCGLALAILVAILEFCWNSKKNAQTDRQSLCSEMAEELRFAIRCHGSRQRPALKRSCTRCSPGTTYVPSALEIQHINGETSLLPMIEMKKSSLSYEGDT